MVASKLILSEQILLVLRYSVNILAAIFSIILLTEGSTEISLYSFQLLSPDLYIGDIFSDNETVSDMKDKFIIGASGLLIELATSLKTDILISSIL